MKRLRYVLFLILPAVAAAAGKSVAGNWDVAISVAGNDSTRVCTFVVKETALSGSCKAPDGSDRPLTGKVDGEKVSWTYNSTYNGDSVTLSYNGTLRNPDELGGTVLVDPYGVQGEFSAKRTASPGGSGK